MASAQQLAIRNAIVLAHLGLPEEVAWHYRHWVNAAKGEWEDAVQAGMVALVEAAEPGKWQPQLGPFNAFAWRRIIWALRHLCHPPKARRKSLEETPQADVGYEFDKPEKPEDEFDVDGLN